MREHLGFGNAANSELKFFTDPDDRKRIGEHNSDNRLHGRGIKIFPDGGISIGYRNDGWEVPGNFINILKDGEIRVGECYFKDGERWARFTKYSTNGKTEEFDKAY